MKLRVSPRIVGMLLALMIIATACTTGVQESTSSGSVSSSTSYGNNTENMIETTSEVEFTPRHEAPADILEEVSFFPTGGDPRTCESETHVHVEYLWPNDCSTPELGDKICIPVCGLHDRENIHVIWRTPTGRIYERDEIAKVKYDEMMEGMLPYVICHQTYLSDMPGTYILTVQGENEIVEESIQVAPVLKPRLYLQKDDAAIFLYNFYPNEIVRLFTYRHTNEWGGDGSYISRLAGWQEYQVNSAGQLLINVPSDWIQGHIWIAVGNMSGEVHEYWGCGQEFPKLLSILVHGTVMVNTGDDKLNVRNCPGRNCDIIAQVSSGTVLKVMEAEPRIVSGEKWWHIIMDDGTSGWVSGSWVIYHNND